MAEPEETEVHRVPAVVAEEAEPPEQARQLPAEQAAAEAMVRAGLRLGN
jgi:hypothetical protein